MTESRPESGENPVPEVPATAGGTLGAKTFVDAQTRVNEAGENAAQDSASKIAIPEIPGVKLQKELGRGGMGVVYRGKQEFLDREVAVKLLLDQKKNAEYIARFKREAKILAGLQHPNIVTCYQADITADGVCFLVMEFVDGPNLRQCIEKEGVLDEADALRVCRDLASALERAHEKKIIHRDVKSENVLLSRAVNVSDATKFRYRAKLTDLGLARPESRDATSSKSLYLTLENAVMGTPLTMSPEQFDDPAGVDHRTDIYGLGCVLYDMLVGQPVFLEKTLSTLLLAKRKAARGPDPRLRRANVSAPVAELAMRMVAAGREDRPQTYEEVIACCEALLPKSALTTSGSWSAQTRLRVLAGVAAALALGSLGILYATRGTTGPDSTSKGQTPQHEMAGEFKLSIPPVTKAAEGKKVDLLVQVLPKGTQLSNVQWVQEKGEPTVALTQDGNKCSFIAPYWPRPYDVSFRVHGDAGNLSAESDIVTISVDAKDDPPTLTIDAPPKAYENEKVTVTAKLTDRDNHGLQKFNWSQKAGPALTLDPQENSVSFVAPEASKDYDVELQLDVMISEKALPRKTTIVHVTAANNPPSVTLKVTPESVVEGKSVSLDAVVVDIDSQDALTYQWQQSSPREPVVKFGNANARQTNFIAPWCINGDYDLSVELQVTDLDSPPLKFAPNKPLTVRLDPNLLRLKKADTLDWSFTEKNCIESGWTFSPNAPKLADGPDGTFVTNMEGDSWMKHELPHGKYIFEGLLAPQFVDSIQCGLRFAYDDKNALCLCFLHTNSELRRFYSYTATMSSDGSWPIPSEDKMVREGNWSINKAMQIELTWDDKALTLRWRDPAMDWNKADHPFALPSRPQSVSLIVSSARISVNSIKVRGV